MAGSRRQRMVGSRRQVWNGSAHHTTGGLTKSDLYFNPKTRRIVSKAKHAAGKNRRTNNLVKAGWTARKGKFGAVRMSAMSPAARRSRRMRGGNGHDLPNVNQDLTKSSTHSNYN